MLATQFTDLNGSAILTLLMKKIVGKKGSLKEIKIEKAEK